MVQYQPIETLVIMQYLFGKEVTMKVEEANEKCYKEQKRNDECNCWICQHEDKCSLSNDYVCKECMITIDGADYASNT